MVLKWCGGYIDAVQSSLILCQQIIGPKLRGLSTYEKKNIAILLVVEQWRPYLQFQEFCIATNHKCMSHLNDQRLHTPWQQEMFTKLLGLDYK
jgi:hypothetical protein